MIMKNSLIIDDKMNELIFYINHINENTESHNINYDILDSVKAYDFDKYEDQEWIHFGCAVCEYGGTPKLNWEEVLEYLDC